MDAQHIEAPFAATFPLPFRVILLGGLGILGWATNLHGLHLLKIDAIGALEIRGHDHLSTFRLTTAPQDAYALARSVYKLFGVYTLWSFFGWTLFRLCTHDELHLVDVYKFIPAVFGLSIVMGLISPMNVFERRIRDTFLYAIRRCIFPSTDTPIYFSDIVLADIFTSFAKVIGDVWLSFCMVIPGGSLLIFPAQDGWGSVMVPCLMSIPYLVRFWQCIVEYMQPTNSSKKPLYNALKYASSFPVIFLSAAQRVVVTELATERGEVDESWHGEHPLFRLWLLSVAVNSLYSFWWDVTNDWGLELLRPMPEPPLNKPPKPLLLPSAHRQNILFDSDLSHARHSSHASQISDNDHTTNLSSSLSTKQHRPWGLRSTLLLPLPSYPLAIFINLVLRLTWSIKLSSHLHTHTSGAVVIFWIEVAELLRRWIWVFFRVEWECVRRNKEKSKFAPEMEDLEIDSIVIEGRQPMDGELT